MTFLETYGKEIVALLVYLAILLVQFLVLKTPLGH